MSGIIKEPLRVSRVLFESLEALIHYIMFAMFIGVSQALMLTKLYNIFESVVCGTVILNLYQKLVLTTPSVCVCVCLLRLPLIYIK